MVDNIRVLPDAKIDEDDSTVVEREATLIYSMMPKLPDGVDEDYWKNLKDNFSNQRMKTSIKITKIPIGQGQTSYAFKIWDDERDCDMVGKID